MIFRLLETEQKFKHPECEALTGDSYAEAAEWAAWGRERLGIPPVDEIEVTRDRNKDDWIL